MLVGLITFPFAIFHIFFGERGTPAIQSLSRLTDLPLNLQAMLHAMSRELFGGFIPFLGLLIIFSSLLLIKYMHCLKNNPIQKIERLDFTVIISKYKENIGLISLSVSVITSFIVISKASPYLDPRYIFFLYPLIMLLVIFSVYKSFMFITKNKKVLFIGILLLFSALTISSYRIGNLQYIYPDADKILKTAQDYSDYDVIFITDQAWFIASNLFDLLEFQRIYVMNVSSVPDLPNVVREPLNEGGLILYIDKSENQDIILATLFLDNLERVVPLYSTEFSEAYLIE
jgi:hypothetical protein